MPAQTVLIHSILIVPGLMVTCLVIVSAQQVFIAGTVGSPLGDWPDTVVKLYAINVTVYVPAALYWCVGLTAVL